MDRRTTTAVAPSGARSSSSTTTWERMSAAVIGRVMRDRVEAAYAFRMPIPQTVTDRLTIDPEVAAALAAGTPVVALESTLISHGLPYPQNLEVARASEAAVRAGGAMPATVAVRDGRLLVGLAAADLEALATAPAGSVRKAARPSLAMALAEGGWAATTVSATMIAASAAGIRVFATGGIGGVHRGALGGSAPSFDISSDLQELGRTAMAVVCAGPKAILDVPATLEYLETLGVPVVTVGQDDLPGFVARSSGIRSPLVASDLSAAAASGRDPSRARPGERRAGVRARYPRMWHSPWTSRDPRWRGRPSMRRRPGSAARP